VTLLRDDRILRVMIVRNEVSPAFVEWWTGEARLADTGAEQKSLVCTSGHRVATDGRTLC